MGVSSEIGLLSGRTLLDFGMALSIAVLIAVTIKSAYLSKSPVDWSPEKSAEPSVSSSVDSNTSRSVWSNLYLVWLIDVFLCGVVSIEIRRQYSQKEDPAIKTRNNQLQKRVKEDLKVESLVSWEKFCNSVSLKINSNESWRKIKNVLKPKGQRHYPTLRQANKVAKTNAEKTQLFAESVERHFIIKRPF